LTTFILVRHAHNDWIDKGIPGWTAGVHLNEQGQKEALRLAERFAPDSVSALFSSPLERAKETAAPLANKLGLEISIRDDLGEVRCGKWTGLLFSELSHEEIAELFDSFRNGMRIPGGESITHVQERIVRCFNEIRRQYPNQRVAVVSHGDPIKTIVAHYAGIPLEFYNRLEIRPCSVTILEVDTEHVRIVSLNDCGTFAV
jgi:probable phosphoglycerate mutase